MEFHQVLLVGIRRESKLDLDRVSVGRTCTSGDNVR